MNGTVKRLPVKNADGSIELIEIDRIFYLEARGENTLIRTRRKKPYNSLQRLGELANKLPAPAFIPLSMFWFGTGNIQKLFIISIGVLPYMSLYTAEVVANTEKIYLEAAYTLGVEKLQALKRVIVPRALPHIYDICRIEMAGAWALVITVEVVAASMGIGHRLVLAQRYLQTANIFAELVIIGFIGLLIDISFKLGTI